MTSDSRQHPIPFRSARAGLLAWLLLAVTLACPAGAAAQHDPAPQHGGGPAAAAPGQPADAHGAGAAGDGHGAAAAEGTHGEEGAHEQTTTQTIAKLVNFAILVGALAYFLRGPIAAHLASRASTIRQDLVSAAEMRSAAAGQLAEIDAKLKALPAELEALRTQGAADVTAERARIAAAAEAERARLIEQTRREIETRFRVARRELTAHAARLAVSLAESRIRQTITPEDQLRLVDRFTSQLKEAR